MANAFLANLGHLIFKISGGAWILLIVPPSSALALLASVFTFRSTLDACYQN
jgi:hypothetical protein